LVHDHGPGGLEPARVPHLALETATGEVQLGAEPGTAKLRGAREGTLALAVARRHEDVGRRRRYLRIEGEQNPLDPCGPATRGRGGTAGQLDQAVIAAAPPA